MSIWLNERKVQPDGCRVEFSSGDVKNGESSGSAKLAKEDTQGEDGTLRQIHFIFLKVNGKSGCSFCGDRILETSSRTAAAMQEAPGRTRAATFGLEM